jgi:hypothetical protein
VDRYPRGVNVIVARLDESDRAVVCGGIIFVVFTMQHVVEMRCPCCAQTFTLSLCGQASRTFVSEDTPSNGTTAGVVSSPVAHTLSRADSVTLDLENNAGSNELDPSASVGAVDDDCLSAATMRAHITQVNAKRRAPRNRASAGKATASAQRLHTSDVSSGVAGPMIHTAHPVPLATAASWLSRTLKIPTQI